MKQLTTTLIIVALTLTFTVVGCITKKQETVDQIIWNLLHELDKKY